MRKHQRKLGVMILILVCIFWIHPTFAAGTPPVANETTSLITELFNAILKFLSWGWMLIAFLAGKLMSNDFVYGTFIHLDSALFKLRNYMKNIANFMLGFLFLFGILKSFFTKDAFELKKTLPRYLIAGVIIQMSWFIMGAFIDLANIATAAVGAFPQQFIQGSTDKLSKSKMMQLAVTVPVQVDVSFKENTPLFSTHTGTQTIENMFGKFNDMSGPLMFIGASIFRFQDYNIMNQDITSWKNFTIGLFLKLFLLVAFCVPLFVLLVINLIRIFRLWIWIVFSPLAAIARSFDKDTPGAIKDMGAVKSLGFGNLADVLKLIFQPVVMIGSLSLVMILSIGMYYVLGGDPGNQQQGATFNKTIEQVQLESKGETSTLTDLTSGTEISVDGNLFKDMGNFVGGMIGYLIITGFTVVLIWSLIKISASFSEFTKTTANNIFKWSEKLVTNSNIIPLPTGMASIAAIKESASDTKRYLENASYASKNVDQQTERLQKWFYNSSVGKAAKNTFGINDNITTDIGKTQKDILTRTSNQGVDNILQAFRDAGKDATITTNSANFRDAFISVLNDNKAFKAFMLKSAEIDDKEYTDNQVNILNPDNATGQKMLKFLAYAMNNNVTQGTEINSTKIQEFLKNNKTPTILSTTPLVNPKATPSTETNT